MTAAAHPRRAPGTGGDRPDPVPLLSVRDLHVHAGPPGRSRTLVRDVGFDVAAGQAVGVVGESGSGKTVTARAVMGVPPDGVRAEGHVEFAGVPLLGRPEREVRPLRGTRLAMVLQDPFGALNPLQTVRTHLRESLAPAVRGDRRAAAAEIARRLREVGLDPDAVAGRYPFELSGGMLQRVAIAAALARDPELLIADEPTTALDATTQAEILALLRRLRRDRGMALVLITHDLRVAFSVCDRVLVMYAGSVLEDAPAAELAREPRHPYSLGLMLAEPPVAHYADRLSPIPGAVPAADAVAGSCAFAARCAWRRDACVAARPALVPLGGGRSSACVRINATGGTGTSGGTDGPDGTDGTEASGGTDGSGGIEGELRSRRSRLTAPGTPPPVPRSDPLLVVSDVTTTYRTASLRGRAKETTAVRGVSFHVGAGESLGVVGESGAGKTTLARCVLGLATPSSGSIRLGGFDVSDYRRLTRADRRAVRRLVQVVFQDPYASLNPRLTIGAVLREAVAARGDRTAEPAREVPELLERVGLPAGYARSHPGALSGGERQRAAIARALAVRPRLLVCDEPVAALDVSVRAQILELLREVRADRGTSMILITHDLSVVRQMTDRALVLCGGEVVESGATPALLDAPGHPYTRRLVAAVPGGS